MPGAFVVLEGGEGAGKSTQCRRLADALAARGHEVVVTREPGGTPTGEAIREVLLGSASQGMAARTEALLFAAARAEHAAALIRPAVARGAVVVSDRYLDSSVAYQGAARGLGEERIAELSLWATEGLVPDLTVVLDIDPSVGVRRAHDANRMEAEPRAFHEAVRGSFLRRAEAVPDRYLVLPADHPKDVLAARILDAVLALLPDEPSDATPAPVSTSQVLPPGASAPVGTGADARGGRTSADDAARGERA
ncbi:MAG: dTMP kinase [Candidatus Nanopelagicales bacterium]|jgi:dTMP kinase|nr:dTMP kinase [Candidatus Nanopelagicales bacterium]